MPFRPVVNPKKLQTTQRFGARYLAPSNTVMGARHYTPLPHVAAPKPAAATPAAVPGAPGSPTTTPAAPAAPDPRDFQYYNDSAKLVAQHDNTQADLVAQRDSGRLNTRKALAMLAERRPEDIASAKNAANKAGLFYSGALGKNLGGIEVNYARSVRDQNDQQAGLEESVARQIAANDAQYGDHGLAYNDAYLGAIDRQTQRDQDRGVPNPNIDFKALARLIAAQKKGSSAPSVISSAPQPTTRGAAPRGNWAHRPWGQGYVNPLTRYLGGGHPARNRR